MTGARDAGVIWSVNDPQGGSIDQNGVYTAPAVKGIYPVTAASRADPTCNATVMIVVD